MTRLVFWYGVKFEDRGQAYSFLPEAKIVHYEEGERLGYCTIPKKIQQKLEKEAKLSKTEEQILRGLTEIEQDMRKDKSERVAWMMPSTAPAQEQDRLFERKTEKEGKVCHMIKEEKMIEKRAKAAVCCIEYRERKAREKAEAQGLEYTMGKAGRRKSRVALLEWEQLKYTKCEDLFLTLMKQLTQAKDDTNVKVALNCIESIIERVELLTPPFFCVLVHWLC